MPLKNIKPNVVAFAIVMRSVSASSTDLLYGALAQWYESEENTTSLATKRLTVTNGGRGLPRPQVRARGEQKATLRENSHYDSEEISSRSLET
ncbi:hypothetical protein F4779DRAFT_618122 [Xylariaceae sp. FL0662B]|nr:hypothetical protein F4779DRAFT_618122 [Xylariaceae sp. FL0662B]